MIRINLHARHETLHPKRRVALALFLVVLLLGSLSRATLMVVDGQVATSADYPAVVSISISDPSSGAGAEGWDGSCTGFLVAPKLILTAAHCVQGHTYFTSITNAPDIRATKGAYSFKADKSGSYPDYVAPEAGTSPKDNIAAVRIDIGYITLKDAVPASTITPLPIFVTHDSPSMLSLNGLVATIVGYGATKWEPSGDYRFSKVGVKHFGDKPITDVQLGYITLEGEKNGGLPGDSGGPILANIGGVPTVVALDEGMNPGTASVPKTNKDGTVKRDGKGNPKMETVAAYGSSIGTMLTRDNLCWVVSDSKIEIPGLDCTPAGASQ